MKTCHTLISCLSKVFESILNRKILNPFSTGTHFYLENCVRLYHFIDIRKIYGGQKINDPQSSLF
ncbi:hypothetical protein E2C01_003804 [Portunus trituberculatus]|uniref:Uncharacterized protein n=1 Tax=Portunus trituberculatus TaxID=210409 RepID=A0A5B7CN99_PORTR|nr:hypothetical protein [Portunus trituberculatus]